MKTAIIDFSFFAGRFFNDLASTPAAGARNREYLHQRISFFCTRLPRERRRDRAYGEHVWRHALVGHLEIRLERGFNGHPFEYVPSCCYSCPSKAGRRF